MTLSASFLKKPPVLYLMISIFCAVFSAVYLRFSHGIVSHWMQYLCLIPLFGGCIPALLLRRCRCISPASRIFYRCALFTCGLYALLRGVMEIYGTHSALLSVYPLAALILFLLAVLTLARRAQ